MSKPLMLALATGLLSGGLFLAALGAGLGFVFLFLPSLPLFVLGLSRTQPPSATPTALAAAAFLVAIVGGAASALLFLLFLGLPSWHFMKKALLGAGESADAWYPVGRILMELSLYACGLTGLMAWHYAGDDGGLPALLSRNIRAALTEMPGDYADAITLLAGAWAFLVFPVTAWLWALLLYAHAWLANHALARRGLQRRPDLAARVFALPVWTLHLLAIAALAVLIGSPSMRFFGQASLLCLLLPYFILGCALMHRASAAWPNRRFFLFLIYFMVATQLWLALILAGAGLWHQIKRLSAGENWSKS